MIKAIATLRSVLFYSVLAFVLTATLVLTWLRWDSARPRQAWFDERQGDIATVTTERTPVDFGQSSESVRLVSDSGLRVDFRVIRKANRDAPTP
ncbi:MAG: hypothetical protein WBN07_17260, partial [Woeseiaceae bacterium]